MLPSDVECHRQCQDPSLVRELHLRQQPLESRTLQMWPSLFLDPEIKYEFLLWFPFRSTNAMYSTSEIQDRICCSKWWTPPLWSVFRVKQKKPEHSKEALCEHPATSETTNNYRKQENAYRVALRSRDA